MEKRLTGIVLKSVDYKETDKLVTLFTKEEGKVLIKIRGAKKSKSKLRFATFPFFYGVYLLTETKGGFVVTGVDQLNRYDYSSIDLNYYYLGALVLELTDKLSMDNFVDEDLFEFTLDSLKKIKTSENAVESAIYLIKDALDVAGHGLNRVYSENSNGFSFDEGGLVNLNKTVGMRLTPEMVDSVKNLLSDKPINGCLSNLLSLLSSYFASKTTKKLFSVEQILLLSDVLN